MWSQYLNVADGQTDDVGLLSHNRALSIASHCKKGDVFWETVHAVDILYANQANL